MYAPRRDAETDVGPPPEMPDIIITVFAARRRRVLEVSAGGLTLIGGEVDHDVRRIASFASRNRIPVVEVEVGIESDAGKALANQCSISRAHPAVVFGKHQVIDPPTPRGVAAGFTTRPRMSKRAIAGTPKWPWWGCNSAGQAAMFLARTARYVHVLVRGDTLSSSMSDYLLQRLESHPRFTIHLCTRIKELHGRDRLDAITIHDRRAAQDWQLNTKAVFILAGAVPNTRWLSNLVELNDKGFVKTGAEVGAASGYQTSRPGIFAVGDVWAGSVKRVASAVGEGSVVMSAVWSHIADE